MWRVGILIVTLSTLATPSVGQGLRPLTEVWAEESSAPRLLYVLKRCTAVMAVMGARVGAFENDRSSDLFVRILAYGSIFMETATAMASALGNNPENIERDIERDIEDISILYTDEIHKNYLATGNEFLGVVADDVIFCMALGDD